ncbi:MAG: hypothetical protein V4563_06000 [Pseudomonadota bacterium]
MLYLVLLVLKELRATPATPVQQVTQVQLVHRGLLDMMVQKVQLERREIPEQPAAVTPP